MSFWQSPRVPFGRHPSEPNRATSAQRRRAKRLQALLEDLEPRVLLTNVGPVAPAGYAYTQSIATAPVLSNSNAIDDYLLNYYQGGGSAGGPIDFGVNIQAGSAPINIVHGNGTPAQVAWTPVNLVDNATGAITETVSVPMPLNPDGSIDVTMEGESFDPHGETNWPTGVPEAGSPNATQAITTVSEATGTDTVTVNVSGTLNSYFKVNTPVSISGETVTGYNGNFEITGVTSTSFTYADINPYTQTGITGLGASTTGTAASVNVNSDSKLLIYDEDNKILYELYETSRPTEFWGPQYSKNNTTLQWYAGAAATGGGVANVGDQGGGFTEINLNTDDYEYGNETAAGTSYALLEGSPEELPANPSTGTLGHALYFELPKSAWIATENAFPSLKGASGKAPANGDAPFYGARLRLKAGVDLSGLTADQQCVANTLETYGAYLSDSYGLGSDAQISLASYSLDANNQNPLNWDSFSAAFNLPMSDFEWVDQSPQVTSISNNGTTETITGKNFSFAQPVTTLGTFDLDAVAYPVAADNLGASNWYGAEITVGAKDLLVTALGRYVFSGNTGMHALEIVNTAGAVIAGGVSVNTALGLAGNAIYAPLSSAVTLTHGQTYYLVSQETLGGDTWDEANTEVLAGGPDSSFLPIVGTVSGSGTTWVPTTKANYEFGPVDLQYQIKENSTGVAVLFGGNPSTPSTFVPSASVTVVNDTTITFPISAIPVGTGTVDVQVFAGVAFDDNGWHVSQGDPGPQAAAYFGYGLSKQYIKYVYGTGAVEADPTAPPAVTNLTATPALSNEVSLSWTAPIGTSNVSTDPNYVTYNVYRGTVGGFDGISPIAASPGGATESGGTVTITLASPAAAPLTVGESVTISGVTDSSGHNYYDGVFSILTVVGNTFTYTDTHTGLSASGGGMVSASSALVASGLTATAYNDTSVTNGTTYYYQVDAINAINLNAGYSSTTQWYQDPKSNEIAMQPTASPTNDIQDRSFQSDLIPTASNNGTVELTGFSSDVWEQAATTTTGTVYNNEPDFGAAGDIASSTLGGVANPSAKHVNTVAGVWNPTTDSWAENAIGATLADTNEGSPMNNGTASLAGATWTVTGGGAGVGGASDQFNFASNSFANTYSAAFATITSVSSGGSAGVMWRDSTNTATSGNAFLYVKNTGTGYSVGFTYRWENGASTSTAVTVSGITIPIWLRLVRSSGVFYAYYSNDGSKWTLLATSAGTSISATALVGLAVSSNNNTAPLATAAFTNIFPGVINPFPQGGYDGNQVAWVDAPTFASTGAVNTTSYNQIIQQASQLLLANTIYTLTVAVGARTDTLFAGDWIKLEYGSVNPITGVVTSLGTLASITPNSAQAAPVGGGFGTVTLNFTTPASGGPVGQHLIIVLATNPFNNAYTSTIQAGQNNQVQPQTDFDNLVLTTAPASTNLVTGVTVSTVQGGSSTWYGTKITIGSSNIAVADLGRYKLTGNSQIHTVKLVDASTGLDVTGGSASVNMASGTVGSFDYAPVTGGTVTLMAGHSYYLVSAETSGGDTWYTGGTYEGPCTVTTTSAATVVASIYYYVSGSSWAQGAAGPDEYGPLDLQYTIPQMIVGQRAPGNSPDLTASELAPVVAEAIDAWAATGLSAQQIALLKSVQFVITDLPQGIAGDTSGLGAAAGGVIYLDLQAGGYGWSVGKTVKPGRVDLLTVVAHELGHILGLPDVTDDTATGGIMDTTLPVGVRRLPTGIFTYQGLHGRP